MAPLIPFPTQVPWADTSNIQGGLPSQTFKQYLSQVDGIVRPGTLQGGSPRIVLGAATSFNYKPSTGSDTAGDGSAGNPWASPGPLYSRYDFGNQNVTINLLENTATQFPVLSWVGGGSLLVNLGGFSIATTMGGFAGDAISSISGALPGPVTIQNGTLSASNGSGIRNATPGLIKIGTGLTFGACQTATMLAVGGGTIELTNSYTVNGGGFFHWFVDNGGQITDRGAAGKTVTISGSPTFGIAFANAVDAGTIIMLALVFSPTTAAFTGKNFSATADGIINSGARGLNLIPGSVAGTTGTGGQYL